MGDKKSLKNEMIEIKNKKRKELSVIKLHPFLIVQ